MIVVLKQFIISMDSSIIKKKEKITGYDYFMHSYQSYKLH